MHGATQGQPPRHHGAQVRCPHVHPRAERQRSKGQAMVIFALSLTVLIAILGLAIDTVRVYDLYARMQRAAEAGALAGSIYLPYYYAAPGKPPADPQSAISRALEETVKNGFGTVPPSPTYPDCPAQPDPTVQTVCSACPNPPTSITVAVCPVLDKPTDLRVTITETINVLFLGAVGVGPTTISASAQAEYMPPIQLGSRANYFGDEVECSSGGSQNTNSYACAANARGNHLQYFQAVMNGPAELKESGDPMVYCAEGPAEINGVDSNTSLYTYNGYPTDHAQWPGISGSPTALDPISSYCGAPQPGVTTGNPDFQPPGFNGPATANTAHPGGYNYMISVSPGIAGSVWIYNANYVPQDEYSGPTPDHFVDAGSAAPNFYQGPSGEGIGANFNGYNHDAPLFFYTTTVSLYAVSSIYNRATDTLVASQAFAPYDGTLADLSTHGCNTSSQVYNPYWDGGITPNTYYNPGAIVAGQGCVPPPPCMQQWCPLSVPGGLGPGFYRLVIEATGLNATTSAYTSTATDGWGAHSYALKVCDTATPSSPIGCSSGSGKGAGQFNSPPGIYIYGWNNMDVTFNAPLGTLTPNTQYPQSSCVSSNGTPYACMDLGCISAQYAGRTLTVRIYDVGDGQGSGNLYVGVVPPSRAGGGSVTYPSYTTTTTIDGDTVVLAASGSYRPFNGLWLDVTITLPAGYSGDCTASNTGWWQLVYASGNGFQPTDTVGVALSIVGSPVHIVPVG